MGLLTNSQCKNAKPDDGKGKKLRDGDGLYLIVTDAGGKVWHFRCRIHGKEQTISFGPYPAVSLHKAREKKDKARILLADGKDPRLERKKDALSKRDESENTFKSVGQRWVESKRHIWSEGHYLRTKSRLEDKLIVHIGDYPMAEITSNPKILLDVLRISEKKGKYETTQRVKAIAGRVFKFAVAEGITGVRNIVPDLHEAFTAPKKKHRAAIIDPKGAGRLMLALDTYEGSPIVCSALKLAPHVFVRPGELRHAEWSEFDFDERQWMIPGEKMKMGDDHIVPLSNQSIEHLRFIQRYTGGGRYVFHSARSIDRPMSEAAVLVALRNMGYEKHEMTGHGFRAMARTLIAEQLELPSEWIEAQLAHAVRDPLRGAYNRTKFLKQRIKMMQKWSDYLDQLRAEAARYSIAAQ
ncbi:MAG: integrase arm-type DNA-binding domain-containing protein [Parvularculales bacterium]